MIPNLGNSYHAAFLGLQDLSLPPSYLIWFRVPFTSSSMQGKGYYEATWTNKSGDLPSYCQPYKKVK